MHETHDHSVCVQDALDRAEQICNERGSRFTKLRRQILEMVWQGHKAVKAYDLLDQLAAEGGSAKPPTVYRALDFLMEQGFVHKIQSLNAYVGCPTPGRKHVSQFLICDKCDGIEEVTSHAMTNEIEAAAKRANFLISSQTVELHGICRNCQ